VNVKGEGEGRVAPVPKHLAMRCEGALEVKLHTFLTLALLEGELSASCLDHAP
jgi:hypothetical protein